MGAEEAAATSDYDLAEGFVWFRHGFGTWVCLSDWGCEARKKSKVPRSGGAECGVSSPTSPEAWTLTRHLAPGQALPITATTL